VSSEALNSTPIPIRQISQELSVSSNEALVVAYKIRVSVLLSLHGRVTRQFLLSSSLCNPITVADVLFRYYIGHTHAMSFVGFIYISAHLDGKNNDIFDDGKI